MCVKWQATSKKPAYSTAPPRGLSQEHRRFAVEWNTGHGEKEDAVGGREKEGGGLAGATHRPGGYVLSQVWGTASRRRPRRGGPCYKRV